MNKLYIIQELVDAIDNTIDVEWSDDDEYWSSMDYGVILIPKTKSYNIDDYILMHLELDKGFKWYNYCSYEVFIILHEIGHHINGWIDVDGYSLVINSIGTMPKYKMLEAYIATYDERFASDWAYDFIKANKDFVKRLSKELAYAV